MDSKNKAGEQQRLLERIRKSGFPPAAVLGAFTSFAATAFGSKPEGRANPQRDTSLIQISFSERQRTPALPPLDIEYSQVLTLKPVSGAKAGSLSGIAVDSSNRIYALGNGGVCVFSPEGSMIRSWKAPEGAQCLTVGPGGRVYFGLAGRIEIHEEAGTRVGSFATGESGRPANVTAVKIFGGEIFVADAAARCIRRFDPNGKQLGIIGTQARSFMLPNRWLDIDVDASGLIRATDTGRHRVASWTLDGSPAGYFGKFGQTSPEDFVGCCNPVNLAIAPDGKVVTAEKVIARVKVYSPDGKLLALIGPEHFDPKCVHLHLAVDSIGRILVADPVRLEVKIFSSSVRSGGSKNV